MRAADPAGCTKGKIHGYSAQIMDNIVLATAADEKDRGGAPPIAAHPALLRQPRLAERLLQHLHQLQV